MTMRRNFLPRQRHILDATDLAHNVGDTREAALVNRNATPQVGECKRVQTVAAIGGANQIEQRGILTDGDQLTVAKRPAYRRKIKAETADFPNERLSHDVLKITAVDPTLRS